MAHPPGAVLYVCSLNRVRSPMAAGLTRRLYGRAVEVQSCGLEPSDEIDPLVAVVMQEIGVDLSGHRPKAFSDFRSEDFDLIVALSAEAWSQLSRDRLRAEYWPVDDPAVQEGSREMRLEAYRQTRRGLESRITQRFGLTPEWE